MSETYGKLTPICPINSPGVMTTLVNITPVVNLITDLKLGSASLVITGSMASTAPSPTPLNIRIPGFLVAAGNKIHSSTIDFVADFATVNSEGFFGPGTINGLKRILINEAYGSVDIYSNGMGGFYTSGKDVNIKSGKALMNLTLNQSAVGVGDVIKARTATITMPMAMTADMEHTIGMASISMTGAMSTSNDLLLAGSATITAHMFTNANGHIANAELHLFEAVFLPFLILDTDLGQTRPQNTLLARVEFDATDGFVYDTVTSTGVPRNFFPLTDWTNATSEIWRVSSNPSGQWENLQLRATVLTGTMPTAGFQQNIWLDFVKGLGSQPQVIFFENTLPIPGETARSTNLLIELSEDAGATILASGEYFIAVTWTP